MRRRGGGGDDSRQVGWQISLVGRGAYWQGGKQAGMQGPGKQPIKTGCQTGRVEGGNRHSRLHMFILSARGAGQVKQAQTRVCEFLFSLLQIDTNAHAHALV